MFTANIAAARGKGKIISELDSALAELVSVHADLKSRETIFEARLVRLRAEIDDYLDAQ